MKRTSLKRKTPMKRMSKRRQKESKVYAKLRAEFLEAKPICEICGSRRSQDVHHRAGRYGGNFLNVATWMAVCRQDHDFIHRNPLLAREMGYLETFHA